MLCVYHGVQGDEQRLACRPLSIVLGWVVDTLCTFDFAPTPSVVAGHALLGTGSDPAARAGVDHLT